MKRSSFVLLIAIAMLTGFTARSMFVRMPDVAPSASEGTRDDVAAAFYEALNSALGGVEFDSLAASLSPIFVDHNTDTGATRSADAFLAEVRAVSASRHHRLRMDVHSVEPSGGNVIIRADLTQTGTIDVASVSVAQSRPVPRLEMIRIERGMIVDRWAPTFRWVDVSESDEAMSIGATTTGLITTLFRVELRDFQIHAWRAAGSGRVAVMSGTAVLQMATGDTSTSAVMDSGSFASIPAGSQVRLRSASGAPMSAMIYVAVRAEARDVAILAGAGDSAKQQGTLSVLWSGSSYSMTSKTDHRFARLVLTPGDTIELTPTPGTQLLLGVDTGIIEIGVTGGNVELLGPDRWPAPAEGIVEVGASHAANIPGSGTVHVRNVTDAPVTLVLVAIEQVGVPDGGI